MRQVPARQLVVVQLVVVRGVLSPSDIDSLVFFSKARLAENETAPRCGAPSTPWLERRSVGGALFGRRSCRCSRSDSCPDVFRRRPKPGSGRRSRRPMRFLSVFLERPTGADERRQLEFVGARRIPKSW